MDFLAHEYQTSMLKDRAYGVPTWSLSPALLWVWRVRRCSLVIGARVDLEVFRDAPAIGVYSLCVCSRVSVDLVTGKARAKGVLDKEVHYDPSTGGMLLCSRGEPEIFSDLTAIFHADDGSASEVGSTCSDVEGEACSQDGAESPLDELCSLRVETHVP
jgi:hypothetical protein